MMQHHPNKTPCLRVLRRGLSLVEVSVSTVLVGLIIVGALRCLATATMSAESTSDHSQAILLAEDLMEEILQQDYSEPTEEVRFGRELTESASDRSSWDDVDDYDNWSASPPVDADGTAVAADSWTRRVTVVHVDPADLHAEQSDQSDTGVKRITVEVLRSGSLVAELTGVQTRGWISSIPDYSQADTTGRLPPANEAPTSSIEATPLSGSGSVTVSFDAAASFDPEGDPLEYNWTFEGAPPASGMQTHQTFQNPTDETIAVQAVLTVQDIHGATDQSTVTITIHPPK